jgi:chaperonin GroEL
MSKPTLVLSDKKVIDVLKKGVDAISIPVSKTLGPEAGTTLMYRTYNRGPRNVDDGFYTSEVIVPKDPFVRLVSEFYKEATMRTNRKVGDGTSATTVIGSALFNEIYSRLQAKSQGYSSGAKTETKGVMQLKREILEEATKIKEAITKSSTPIKSLKDLEKISAISLGGDNEISKIVAKMAWEVGIDGFIDVVEGYKNEIETEVVKGMRFSAKTCGKTFVNKPERYEMVVEDCPVFITNHKLDNDLLVRFMMTKFESTKVIIIAPDFSEQVLVNMVLARQNGTFIWPVKIPSVRTEIMEDIAIYCGAKLFDKNKGDKLQSVTKADLGYVEKLTVKDVETKEDAILLGGKGTKPETFTEVEFVANEKGGKSRKEKIIESTAVAERIKVLKGQLEETKEPQFQMLMKRRIASMASAGGVIRVGSPTDAESLPLKLKIEDDVFACRAALKSGYVKGGGLCLKDIANKLKDDNILKIALLSPYKQIQENAGGFLEIGKDVIDPTDAVYYAVEHATSVVASLITIKNLVVEEPEIQQGEGEMKLAQSFDNAILAWKKKEGILTENEKLQLMDANGGLSQDEIMMTDTG